MDDSRHEKEETGIERYHSGLQDIRMKKWFQGLMDDCQDIMTEALYISRWALVEGYHNLGKRILEEHNNFERSKIYGKKILQTLAESLNVSSRSLEYAIQFVKKYPTLDLVPEGKNITWNKIITKYLTEPKTGTITQKEYWIKCPNCGHKFTMDKYHE